MSRKPKSKRRSAQEVLNTFTRENVVGYIAERDALSSQLRAVDASINAMKAAGIDETHIETVRNTVAAGAFQRLSYLEMQVRRAALAITRAGGYNHLRQIVESNLDKLPSVEEKQAVTLSTL